MVVMGFLNIERKKVFWEDLGALIVEEKLLWLIFEDLNKVVNTLEK